jgi:hypothetical protein
MKKIPNLKIYSPVNYITLLGQHISRWSFSRSGTYLNHVKTQKTSTKLVRIICFSPDFWCLSIFKITFNKIVLPFCRLKLGLLQNNVQKLDFLVLNKMIVGGGGGGGGGKSTYFHCYFICTRAVPHIQCQWKEF